MLEKDFVVILEDVEAVTEGYSVEDTVFVVEEASGLEKVDL